MDPHLLSSTARLSNDELLARVKQLATCEREVTVALIAHLAELDARRLYLAEGYSSTFAYCTKALHLSEHAAYGRIAAARAARRFPVILEMLESGSVNLTTVVLLVAHLTPENHREVLEAARDKTRPQVEELVARLRPQADVPVSVRRLPTAKQDPAPLPAPRNAAAGSLPAEDAQEGASLERLTLAPAPPPAPPAVVAPLAPERYRIQFTASAQTHAKLRCVQDLLRHQIPDGDVGQIIDRALSALLEDLAKKKLAATDRPRASRGIDHGSRTIPAAVKRDVWLRDDGRCAFIGKNGHRCAEGGFLELHHVVPHAAGGAPTVDNIQLRCRAHNGYEAELYFGRRSAGVKEPRAHYSVQTEYRLEPRRTLGFWRAMIP